MNIRISKRLLVALPLVGALALGACEDDPTGLDEDHTEPAGLTITLSGQTIATYSATTGWTGELEVEAGTETAHLDVTFLAEDGDAIALDDDLYLEVVIDDESIAEFEQDTPGEFGGHLHGLAAGETDATFMLMHGAVGSGHEDFVTTSVHVHVN